MNATVDFPLQVSANQADSLRSLQRQFAEACNFLAPLVRAHRCWNRVALHHLAYKELRERFPQLGSQMACNAIYSVCRSARIVYQHPRSPWNASCDPSAELPLLRFLPESPVFFDRHTLSLRDGLLSLYTLDGRMHFRLDISPEILERFRRDRLREIALLAKEGGFTLRFVFAAPSAAETPDETGGESPEYVLVESAPDAPATAMAA